MSMHSSMHSALRSAVAILSLVACGRSDNASNGADADASGATPAASQQAEAAAATTDAPRPLIDVMPGTASPITGAIIEVRMIGDAKGYRFEPQLVTAKAGDGVKFVVISGGPHEIAFDLKAVPSESRSQLQINMPNSVDGKSPLLSGEQETWTLSLGALKPGVYPFVSTPRLPQGMKGEIEIK